MQKYPHTSMTRLRRIIFGGLLVVGMMFINISPTFAVLDLGANGGAAGIENVQNGISDIPIQNPLGGTADNPQGITDIRSIIALVIKAMLGLIGSLALLMFVYGGFLWLTSRGNTEMVAKGSKAMVWSSLGLALIFSSYALVQFIFKAIGAAGS